MSRETIDPAPFLAWCDEHERQIEREINTCPAIKSDKGGKQFPWPADCSPHRRLIFDLGWEPMSGGRRLLRWRSEGQAQRSLIEDACLHVGVDFDRLYPDIPHARLGPSRVGLNRKMTDAQVLAAHALYTRRMMTMGELANLIWQRFGYASPDACRTSLGHSFRVLGLPARRCGAPTTSGALCGAPPLRGEAHCPEHLATWEGARPSAIAKQAQQRQGYEPSPELVAEVRERHTRGEPLLYIARDVLDRTPLRSAKRFAQTLSDIAKEQGWHNARRHVYGRTYDDWRASA